MATKTAKAKAPKISAEERARTTLASSLQGALARARARAAIAESAAEGARAVVGSLERSLGATGAAPAAQQQLPLAAQPSAAQEDLRAELARVKGELAQLRAAVQKTPPAPAPKDGLVNIVLYKQETEGEVEWVAFVRETCMPVTAPTRSEALACVAETLEGYDDALVRSAQEDDDLEEEQEARPLGAVLPPAAFGTATSWHALGKEWGKRDPRWKPELAADPAWVAATRLEDHELQIEELRPPELDELLRGIRAAEPTPELEEARQRLHKG